jgi:hypothetical protein
VSEKGTIKLFTVNDKPFGKGLDEWSANWWRWLCSIPKDQNPAMDDTGKNGGQNQNNPNVWFLAGTTGGSAERTYTIPSGKAILLPIVNYECSFAEEPGKDEKGIANEVSTFVDNINIKELQASIDGNELEDKYRLRMKSPLFNVTFPRNNIWGVQDGNTQAVSDGYWVFIEDLPVGKHKIHVRGPLEKDIEEATFNLTVE